MLNIILATFTAYIIALVIGGSSLFDRFRTIVISKTPYLKIGSHKHFIECRLCLTFWTSVVSVLLFGLSLKLVFPVYGAAYWLCTQER